MAAIASLTIKDGASTPANHTFSPRNPQGLNNKDVVPAKWIEPGNTFVMDKTVTLSNTTNGNRTSITRGQVKVPALVEPAEGSGTTDTIEEGLFTFDFRIPPLYSESDRKDLYAYAVSLLQLAIVKAAVETNERVY